MPLSTVNAQFPESGNPNSDFLKSKCPNGQLLEGQFPEFPYKPKLGNLGKSGPEQQPTTYFEECRLRRRSSSLTLYLLYFIEFGRLNQWRIQWGEGGTRPRASQGQKKPCAQLGALRGGVFNNIALTIKYIVRP